MYINIYTKYVNIDFSERDERDGEREADSHTHTNRHRLIG